jgi:deoxyribodipyrimidine photo-lyase
LKVFTPFYRRWSLVDFTSAVETPVSYADAVSHCQGYPDIDSSSLELPDAGEEAAWRRWEEWSPRLEAYQEERNNPGVDGTSLMSPYLRFGVVHRVQIIIGVNLHGVSSMPMFCSISHALCGKTCKKK